MNVNSSRLFILCIFCVATNMILFVHFSVSLTWDLLLFGIFHFITREQWIKLSNTIDTIFFFFFFLSPNTLVEMIITIDLNRKRKRNFFSNNTIKSIVLFISKERSKKSSQKSNKFCSLDFVWKINIIDVFTHYRIDTTEYPTVLHFVQQQHQNASSKKSFENTKV